MKSIKVAEMCLWFHRGAIGVVMLQFFGQGQGPRPNCIDLMNLRITSICYLDIATHDKTNLAFHVETYWATCAFFREGSDNCRLRLRLIECLQLKLPMGARMYPQGFSQIFQGLTEKDLHRTPKDKLRCATVEGASHEGPTSGSCFFIPRVSAFSSCIKSFFLTFAKP